MIPAILILGSKTYGRKGYGNSAKNYYKCYPQKDVNDITDVINDDKYRNPLLVLYAPNINQFSKKLTNKYILIEKISKTHAKIVDVIGSIDDFDAYCQWELCCNNLNHSVSNLNKKLKKKIELDLKKEFPQLPVLTDRKIYTMDPKESRDFDDAFSICETKISIYITNVPMIIENLGLWESMSSRVSTVYLPENNYPMLPKKISEHICSLTKGNDKVVLVFDYFFNSSIKIYPAIVKIDENLEYDSKHPISEKLLNVSKKLNDSLKIMDYIEDTHEAIAFLMLLMNSECSNMLKKENTGIFRSCSEKADVTNVSDPELKKFLSFFNSSGSKYSKNPEKHSMLNLECYTHITSPIRRIVDLLNLITIQEKLGLFSFSKEALEFYENWMDKIDFINEQTKNIKRVQTKTLLLKLCLENENLCLENENLNEYRGFPINALDDSDNIYKYDIYLPKIKMISRITTREKLNINQEYFFKIYIFLDESTFHKKIQIDLIDK